MRVLMTGGGTAGHVNPAIAIANTIKEYEKLSATVKLFSELSKGEESAKEKGWIDSKDVKEILGL